MLDSNAKWTDVIQALDGLGETYVLVTLLGVQGSAPRNSGTKMVVTENAFFASIGGGHLEHKGIAIARDLISSVNQDQHIEHFPLAASLGQCCGGSVSLLFEKFAAKQVNIQLFGAGHVGQALTSILAGLPCRVHWVDSRTDIFPQVICENTRTFLSEYPEEEVEEMPASSYYIVMTHNHQVDLDICTKILERGDFAFLGLIGSQAKWSRFQRKLKHNLMRLGKNEVDVDGLIQSIVCPIGLADVPGKLPMEVAVSIAGQLIEHYQFKNLSQGDEHKEAIQGLTWSELNTLSKKLLVQG
ncbi:MAG: xanthine dehydrogenase accessory factor [Candidatus Azotimanducaceae bacterium]|jgi:xanthine dehydrogenase accessory factor